MTGLSPIHWTFQSAARAVISAVTFPGKGSDHVIFVHGNGLCKEVFVPIVSDFRSTYGENATIHMYDLRGHGDSTESRLEIVEFGAASSLGKKTFNQGSLIENFDSGAWWLHVADFMMLIANIKSRHGIHNVGSLHTFGYSMGGAIAVMAQVSNPGLLSGVILYEPIILPHAATTPLAARAAARRDQFPSRAAARSQYLSKSKSIYHKWDPRCFDAYLEHGFRDLPSDTEAGVTLKCAASVEAKTFQEGHTTGIWELMESYWARHTILIQGGASMHLPTPLFQAIRNRLNHEEFIVIPGGDHFVPMENPMEMATQLNKLLERSHAVLHSKL